MLTLSKEQKEQVISFLELEEYSPCWAKLLREHHAYIQKDFSDEPYPFTLYYDDSNGEAQEVEHFITIDNLFFNND
jgi:hypothetical protein